MRHSPIKIFSGTFLIASLMGTCFAAPQAVTTTTSAAPTASPIPWSTKFESFRSYILEQPDQNATAKGFCSGPLLRKTFDDGVCLQMNLCDWDCNHDLPYKMRGVAKWFNETIPHDLDPIWDSYRYYSYGYYADPDDGWNYYGASRLSFGACGNRGPQSSCGVTYCVDENGKTMGDPALVPEGQTPWMDPNDRNRLCPWLRH